MELFNSPRIIPMQARKRETVPALLENLYGHAIDDPDDEGEILVTVNDTGAVTGLIALSARPWADGCSSGLVGYIEAWHLAPDHRRIGVGGALMPSAQGWTRAKVLSEIGSDVVTNQVSPAAHDRLAWKRGEKIQSFHRDLNAPGPVFVAGPDYDFAALRALILRNFAYMQARIDPPSSMKAVTDADLAALDAMLVIEAGGVAVGCLAVTVKSNCLYVGRMAVDMAWRGLGLARRLMDAAEHLALTKGIAEIELGSRVELTENHAIFLQMGFEKVREQNHPGYDRATSYWFRKRVMP